MRLLAVLLGASILLNIALIARRAPPPEPGPRRVPPAPRAIEERNVSETTELLVLRERVRELEARKPETPDVVEAPDRTADFRAKLARSLKLSRQGRAWFGYAPEAQLDLTELGTEFQRAKLERWANPRAYVERLGAVLEQTAAETKKPFTDAQKAELRRALEDYEVTLMGFADKDALARFVHEAGPEADQLKRLRAFATPELEGKLAALGQINPFTPTAAAMVDRAQAEQFLVQTWVGAYGLEESQKTAVAAAARMYLTATDTLGAQLGRDAMPGRETAEWRGRSAQNLVDALAALESSLTPEQRDRLRRQRPPELRVYDQAAAQRWAR
ncbi:MAG TPA: hypothetical protein VF950_04085 [Planctomycetota bacterium]